MPTPKTSSSVAERPTIDRTHTLLVQSKLADALGVHRDFILAMKQQGFPMPGRRATITQALTWLEQHPKFTGTRRRSPGRGRSNPAPSKTL